MGGKLSDMENSPSSYSFTLRPASSSDAKTIRQIISLVHINPTGLDWRRFILAVDSNGQIIGCGQVKPHADGTLELASIAVLPEWRGRGVARNVIEHLLTRFSGPIYLTCRSELGQLYQKFGFEVVELIDMPPYFKRISRFVNLINRLTRRPVALLVMKR
jgi:N-acetylglutamate synthase-like GNAT family acetyltransferase